MILWVLIGCAISLQVSQVALCWSPSKFWQRIDRKSSGLAVFLWGYSHLFGPRLRVGELKPWWR